MDAWERSRFAISGAEHEVHEAIMALLRVLQHARVSESTRFAIQGALSALRSEQSAPGSGDVKPRFGERIPTDPGGSSAPSRRSGALPVRTPGEATPPGARRTAPS
ncbi:MAG: hypothetical protein OEM05_14445 [Myxococcales bacterium]|nr:hypothetical protein [Myxococcales bacterium]